MNPPLKPGKGTLRRKLVLQVAILVAVTAGCLGIFTSFATMQVLTSELDARLGASSTRIGHGRGGDRDPLPPGGGVGQQVGTIAVQWDDDGYVVSAGVVTESGWGAVDAKVVTALAAVVPNREATTVEVPGLGPYRALSRVQPDGSAVVVGIPMAGLYATLTQLVLLEVVLVIIAVGAAIVIVRALVVRSLRPLTRLASTATSVSQLNLERGEVAIADRVAAADADPETEVGRVGAAFNLMLDNVEHALASRQLSETRVRRFVADASHELRNPLAAIRGYAELTRRERSALPADVSHALDRIESESDRMSALVTDLLLLARLDTSPDIAREPVDVTEVAVNAVADARAAGSTHQWTFSVPSEPVEVIGDPHRLHQVISNLLTNARTHTPGGTLVHTVVSASGPDVVISVSDNGPGIAPEVRGRVFERFVRADESRARTHGSTGLGLAIVEAVVKAHGGTVDVRTGDTGTTFTVTLPRRLPQIPGREGGSAREPIPPSVQ